VLVRLAHTRDHSTVSRRILPRSSPRLRLELRVGPPFSRGSSPPARRLPDASTSPLRSAIAAHVLTACLARRHLRALTTWTSTRARRAPPPAPRAWLLGLLPLLRRLTWTPNPGSRSPRPRGATIARGDQPQRPSLRSGEWTAPVPGHGHRDKRNTHLCPIASRTTAHPRPLGFTSHRTSTSLSRPTRWPRPGSAAPSAPARRFRLRPRVNQPG
jgi:hypothetical protein